jgi:hypothetical protein
MNIYPAPNLPAPAVHAIRTATTGVHARITCTCDQFDTGPVPSMRFAEELHAAHARGIPVKDPVRPLLLKGLA